MIFSIIIYYGVMRGLVSKQINTDNVSFAPTCFENFPAAVFPERSPLLTGDEPIGDVFSIFIQGF